MRRLLTLILTLVAGCTGTRIGNPGNEEPPEGIEIAYSKLKRQSQAVLSGDAADSFAADGSSFAFALYRELAKEPGNLMFSPYSVRTALAMTYAGARGETATEMATALHFQLSEPELHEAFNATDLELAKRKDQLVENEQSFDGDGFQLEMVDQAWGQKGYKFLDSYLDVLALHYGTGMYLVDFDREPERSRKRINDWVADQTDQRIEDVLPADAIVPLTRLILTNAIYFKASWLKKFDPAKTMPGTFMAEAGERAVEMMQQDSSADYAEFSGYRAVSLRYLSPSVRMLVVLPPAGDFSAAAAGFDRTVFEGLRRELRDRFVRLSLPKWSFEFERELEEPLAALGMRTAFDNARADFSGMDGRPDYLYVDEVYHKTFVAVDERGTEAAASTAVVLAGRGPAVEPVTIVFDRPFMFLVYDEPTGQILFLGHLVDPG